MKLFFSAFLFFNLMGQIAAAAALGTSARTVIPADVQQIISVDYRQLSNSSVAGELHDRALPDNMKQFESALKGVGISPARDIDHLTFASFRDAGQIRMNFAPRRSSPAGIIRRFCIPWAMALR